jgi:NAD(P)-dependent dehydrogenase (short-subunit alcohol dehydrogenase family)
LTTGDPASTPPLAGSTVIITGASRGIGRSAAINLAALGARLVMIGRSQERHRAVQADLDEAGASHELIEADLGALSSVVAAGRSIADSSTGLDDRNLILINNAAVAGRRGVTADGFELAFGVNYLAHFLLTCLLLEAHLPIANVINVTSNAHYSTTALDPDLGLGRTRSLLGWREYSHSKAAMAAFTIELAGRVPGTKSLAVHPGVVATGLWRRIPQPFRALVTRRMLPPEVGALPLVRAATDPTLPSGGYLEPEGLRTPSAAVRNAPARARLWDASLQWVEPFWSPRAGNPQSFRL